MLPDVHSIGNELAKLDSRQRRIALGLLADRLLPADLSAAVIATLDAYDQDGQDTPVTEK